MKRFPRLLLVLCVAIVAASVPARPVLAFSCADLDGASLYSDDGKLVYLGFFGHRFAKNSVMNLFGPHGSTTGAESVRNTSTIYGNQISHYGVVNIYAQHPPLIVRNGETIGRLTANTATVGGVALSSIDRVCTFKTGDQGTNVLLPGSPPWVAASDGEFLDKVVVRWDSGPGATSYIVGIGEPEKVAAEYLPETGATSMEISAAIFRLTPDHVYEFGVVALNEHGASDYVVDYGSVALTEPTATPVPPPGSTPTPTPGGTPRTPPDGTLTPAPGSTPGSPPDGTPGGTPFPIRTPSPGDVYLPITQK